jgi:hypothetical protein
MFPPFAICGAKSRPKIPWSAAICLAHLDGNASGYRFADQANLRHEPSASRSWGEAEEILPLPHSPRRVQHQQAYRHSPGNDCNHLEKVGITRKWAEDGILSNSLNPGAIATGLQKHTGGLKTPVERRKTPEQGAATSVLLAASPLLEGISGRYFEDCNEAELLTKRPADLTGGYAAYALDTENADRLWDVSQQLVRGIGE